MSSHWECSNCGKENYHGSVSPVLFDQFAEITPNQWYYLLTKYQAHTCQWLYNGQWISPPIWFFDAKTKSQKNCKHGWTGQGGTYAEQSDKFIDLMKSVLSVGCQAQQSQCLSCPTQSSPPQPWLPQHISKSLEHLQCNPLGEDSPLSAKQ